MIHRRRRAAQQTAQILERARCVLQAVVDGSCDPYEGYREAYGLYVGTSGMVEELKPLFRLAGIEPDGFIHVNDEFRRTVISAALDWLGKNPAS